MHIATHIHTHTHTHARTLTKYFAGRGERTRDLFVFHLLSLLIIIQYLKRLGYCAPYLRWQKQFINLKSTLELINI